MTETSVIYVVDDDTDSRESICELISQLGHKTQAFASAEAFLESYDGHRPACLLTDYRMLGMTGVELLESLRANNVTLSVVVMTAFADTELTVRAIRGGAVTLIEKPFSNTALWKAIREALAEDHAQYDNEKQIQHIRDQIESLTPGELGVLKLIIGGAPNKSAALQLGVSIRTVESRRAAVLEKLQVSSLAELVQRVMVGCPELC